MKQFMAQIILLAVLVSINSAGEYVLLEVKEECGACGGWNDCVQCFCKGADEDEDDAWVNDLVIGGDDNDWTSTQVSGLKECSSWDMYNPAYCYGSAIQLYSSRDGQLLAATWQDAKNLCPGRCAMAFKYKWRDCNSLFCWPWAAPSWSYSCCDNDKCDQTNDAFPKQPEPDNNNNNINDDNMIKYGNYDYNIVSSQYQIQLLQDYIYIIAAVVFCLIMVLCIYMIYKVASKKAGGAYKFSKVIDEDDDDDDTENAL